MTFDAEFINTIRNQKDLKKESVTGIEIGPFKAKDVLKLIALTIGCEQEHFDTNAHQYIYMRSREVCLTLSRELYRPCCAVISLNGMGRAALAGDPMEKMKLRIYLQM